MSVNILSSILFLVFVTLSGFHFYWFFGGVYGVEKAIPTKKNNGNTTAIPKAATLMVAIVLCLFGLIYLSKISLFENWLSAFDYFPNLLEFSYWFIPVVFLLRAIGEFQFVGLFKTIKDTSFAKADSKFFIPLCLGIGLCGIWIQFC